MKYVQIGEYARGYTLQVIEMKTAKHTLKCHPVIGVRMREKMWLETD